MTGIDYRDEVARALDSSDSVPKADYLRWAREGDLGTRARAYKLSADAWGRIRPAPSMEEQCGVMADYLLACIAIDPPSDEFVHGGFEAGAELSRWLKHLRTTPNTAPVIADVAHRLESLFRSSNAAGRNRIETGALEHILEAPDLRRYFKHWGDDAILRDSYEAALAWGLAHGDDPS